MNKKIKVKLNNIIIKMFSVKYSHYDEAIILCKDIMENFLSPDSSPCERSHTDF